MSRTTRHTALLLEETGHHSQLLLQEKQKEETKPVESTVRSTFIKLYHVRFDVGLHNIEIHKESMYNFVF